MTEEVVYTDIPFFIIYNKTKRAFHGGGMKFKPKWTVHTARMYKTITTAERQIFEFKYEDDEDEYAIIGYLANPMKLLDEY